MRIPTNSADLPEAFVGWHAYAKLRHVGIHMPKPAKACVGMPPIKLILLSCLKKQCFSPALWPFPGLFFILAIAALESIMRFALYIRLTTGWSR